MFQYGQNPYMPTATTMNRSPYGMNPYINAGQKYDVVRVNGMDGAKAFQMPPNSSAILLDEQQPLLYLRSTDGAGYPAISVFDITPHVEVTPDPVEYATRKELNELKELILNGKSDSGSDGAKKSAKRNNDAET